MSYTNIFGGYNINTAFPSYKSYTFSTNLSLTWASSFVDNTNVTAQINDLNATAINLSVTLADAKLISVGQTIQFNNVGANAIEIHDFTGGFIATIPPTNNNQFILYLRDNTTQAGIWGVTHLGAGSSSADANQLAGLGTIALNSTINTNFVGKQINANYQVQLDDRANIIVSIGGALTVTLPPVASLPADGGFYIAINNQGSGTVTVTTSDARTIDGAAFFNINPGQSCYFINVLGGSGLNWNSLGYGTPTYFQVQVQSTNLAPHSGGTVTLTGQQALPLVQNFTGALTGNVTVFFPAAAGQWYINNLTSGGFNVNVQLAGPIGSPVLVPQGERVIIYSDGTSMFNSPTITTNAVFGDGSVGSPGITFTSDPSTGFYKLPNGIVGYSSLGAESLAFGGTASGIGFSVLSGNPGVYWDSTNTNYTGFKASNTLISNIIFTLPDELPSADGQILFGFTGGKTNFTAASYPFAISAQKILYSSAANTITEMPTLNNGALVTNGSGNPSFSQTLPTAVQNNITSVGTITAGTWQGTSVKVPFGGTGFTSTNAYGVICGGTSSTANLQNAGTGAEGQVFTSQGSSALPTWKTLGSAVSAASISEMRAASSTSSYVSPGRQNYHPLSPKAWVTFEGATGIIKNSYNVSSVNIVSTGKYKINFSNALASNLYATYITCESNAPNVRVGSVDASIPPTSSQVQIYVVNQGGSLVDPGYVNAMIMGDQ